MGEIMVMYKTSWCHCTLIFTKINGLKVPSLTTNGSAITSTNISKIVELRSAIVRFGNPNKNVKTHIQYQK